MQRGQTLIYIAIPQDCSVAAVDELTDEQAEQLKARAELTRSRR